MHPFDLNAILGYLTLDIICPSKLAVYPLTVCFSEKIMSTVKYPSTFGRQMVAMIPVLPHRSERRTERLKELHSHIDP